MISNKARRKKGKKEKGEHTVVPDLLALEGIRSFCALCASDSSSLSVSGSRTAPGVELARKATKVDLQTKSAWRVARWRCF